METVMFENYHYFLKLAETNNVTQAARELFVTHQCLSRYLAKLEKECGTALFYRKPRFTLTPEGRMLLDTLRQVESLEMDIRQHFREGLEGTSGTIRVGTTEGRFRIFIPPLITSYSALYPHMHLAVTSARPDALEAMMLNNKLDLMLIGQPRQLSRFIKSQIVLQERLYVVLSDAMCRKYFPEAYDITIYKRLFNLTPKEILDVYSRLSADQVMDYARKKFAGWTEAQTKAVFYKSSGKKPV